MPLDEQATREALRKVMALGVGAAGLGTLFRGGQEVFTNFFNPRPLVSTNDGPTIVEMTTLPPNRRKPVQWIRPGGGAALNFKRAAADPFATAGNAVYDYAIKPMGAAPMLNAGLTTPAAKPWMLASGVAAAAGGFAGGSALVSWLAKRRRESELNRELSSAEGSYVDAIKKLRSTKLAELRPLMKSALAAAPPAPAAPAKAPWGMLQGPANAVGSGLNLWGGVAALTALPAAMAAYGYVRNNSDRRALQEAIYQRSQAKQQRSPNNIIMIPPTEEPVPE